MLDGSIQEQPWTYDPLFGRSARDPDLVKERKEVQDLRDKMQQADRERRRNK